MTAIYLQSILIIKVETIEVQIARLLRITKENLPVLQLLLDRCIQKETLVNVFSKTTKHHQYYFSNGTILIRYLDKLGMFRGSSKKYQYVKRVIHAKTHPKLYMRPTLKFSLKPLHPQIYK